jgi:hypothetical protein
MIVVPLGVALSIRGMAANNKPAAMKKWHDRFIIYYGINSIFRRRWYCAGA